MPHPAYRVRGSPGRAAPLVAVPSKSVEVDATAVPETPDAFGAASRFARSMMELVVGTPHVGTAERVVSAGTSIVEFVGAPMRRFVEPAIDNRAEAAQEAMVSLLELTRVVVQEPSRSDLNAVLERIDQRSCPDRPEQVLKRSTSTNARPARRRRAHAPRRHRRCLNHRPRELPRSAN
jgi:hypothetical protein